MSLYAVASRCPAAATYFTCACTCMCMHMQVLYCRDPDANELMLIEDPSIQPIEEVDEGPRVPWTRLW